MNTRDRDLARADGDLFIAESEHLVRRLLASDIETDSVLVQARRAEEIAGLAPPDCPIYAASDPVIDAVLGFKFHSGMIAVGRRPLNPGLESVVGRAGRVTLAVCPEIHNTENLGALIRIAGSMGVHAMLIGQRSCDPFFRRVVRVSMGAVFTLPIVRSLNLRADLTTLRQQWNVEVIATVVDDPTAEVLGSDTTRADRCAILFGSESQGLERYWLEVSDRRLTIPMHLGNDSLNVAVAAGIFLWHLARR